MRATADHAPSSEIRLRLGTPADVDALVALEDRLFTTDRLSPRSFRRFLASAHAALIVAEHGDAPAGYALVLFRPRSAVARLYSIAVAPGTGGRGVGTRLLVAAEAEAVARDCQRMRLEVQEQNAPAIALYRKFGYRQFARREGYYEDGTHALRFEKRLQAPRIADAPPYFHQTTEFTCGPACMMMALAWADPSWRPDHAVEFQLWREATTIFMSSGPGGCEPYGIAVALKRRGLFPEIYVSNPGPYFLDTARSAEKKRVMRLVQAEFQREAGDIGIPTHLTPLAESDVMREFDRDAVAIVLVSGYHMIDRGRPHWVFAFGHEGRRVLVHDPAAMRDDQGRATSTETYSVPWTRFERMMRLRPDDLRAAILIRKGPLS